MQLQEYITSLQLERHFMAIRDWLVADSTLNPVTWLRVDSESTPVRFSQKDLTLIYVPDHLCFTPFCLLFTETKTYLKNWNSK